MCPLCLIASFNSADQFSQFHRGEYTVQNVKDDLSSHGFLVREFEAQL